MSWLETTEDAFTSVEGSIKFVQRAPRQLLEYQEWKGGYHELHHELWHDQVQDSLLKWCQKILEHR